MNALRFERGYGYACAGLLVATSHAYEAAEAQVACPIYQVTRTIDVGLGFENNDASLNQDGAFIAFVSAADLAGNNPGLFAQIFLYDTAVNKFTNITFVNADNYCSGCPSSIHVDNPSISGSGARIAFSSPDDLVGENPEFNEEIFLAISTAGSSLSQITHTADGGSYTPALSANGSRIAFGTTSDVTGENPDGNSEIILYDRPSGTFTQITDTAGVGIFSLSPTINGDGTRVSFDSTADLVGANSDHSSEIFLFDATSGQLFQLTDSSVSSTGPSINSGGSLIAFTTRAEPGCFAPSGNADGNTEVIRLDTADGNSCIQVTQSIGGQSGGGANRGPSIDGGGTRIAFLSNRNLTGENADLNREVFRFDASDGSLVQVTKSTGAGNSANEVPSISGAGNRIAFSSARNLTGQNSDGNRELFLAACLTPPACDGVTPTVVGTPLNDTISGTAGVDVIVGLGGTDTINGLGGNDRICGGDGNDALNGGAGNDRVFGQAGNDAMSGQSGTDVCNGGAGTDSASTCETLVNVP